MFLLRFFKKIFKKLKASFFVLRKADIIESLARQEIERIYGIPYIQKIKPKSNAPAPAPKSNAPAPAPKSNAPTLAPKSTELPLKLNKNQLNIVFMFRGGLGDCIIFANYVYKFRQRYTDEIIRIDIFADSDRVGKVQAVFANHESRLISNIYTWEEYSSYFRDYDLSIDMSRYPDVKRRDLKRLSSIVPELIEYVYICERFRSEHPRFFAQGGRTDGQSGMLNILEGRKRIQQHDVYGFLGVTEKYEFPVHILDDATEYLQKIGINDRPFITLHRGNDARFTKDSIKLWPLSYYDILISLIKAKYPNIMLVQIGPDHSRSPTMQGIDINLVSETTFEQAKVLMKHAIIHIDGESGMVHLRHALNGGPSIVLFGPTSADFYGYSENENIVGSGCDIWCEGAFENWQEQCLRGARRGFPHCMASILPEMVMARMQTILH